MRTSPAMSRADSIRQTASTLRWACALVTTTDQNITGRSAQTSWPAFDQRFGLGPG
jgi:hypothetical protein